MATKNKPKTPNVKSRLSAAGQGPARVRPVTQSTLKAATLIDGALRYRALRSALLPDTPNLSPNEIDRLKALLGF